MQDERLLGDALWAQLSSKVTGQPTSPTPALLLPATENMEPQDASIDDCAIVAYCKGKTEQDGDCQAVIGTFYNSWVKVNNKYHMPTLLGSYDLVGTKFKKKQKMASPQCALSGCFLQPLHCAHCDFIVGTSTSSAPDSDSVYADRELFRHRRLRFELQSSGKPCKPIVEDDNLDAEKLDPPSLLAVDPNAIDTEHVSPMAVAGYHAIPISAIMDRRTESRYTSQSPHTGHVQLPRPSATKRESSASTPTERYLDHRTSTTSSHDQHRHVSNHRESASSSRRTERESLPSLSASRYPVHATPAPPSHLEARLDALDRIQTQVNLNRATLESQNKEIHRFHETNQVIQHDLQTIWQGLKELSTQFRTLQQPKSHLVSNERIDDTLELLAAQVGETQKKVNEIDHLKVKLAILERRLNRQSQQMEASPAGLLPATLAVQHDTASHHTPIQQVAHRVASNNLLRASQGTSHDAARASLAPEPCDIHSSEHEGANSGWATVNSHKRSAHEIDARSDFAATPGSSPKRHKFVPHESNPPVGSVGTNLQVPRLERTETAESRATSTRGNSPTAFASHAGFVSYASQMPQQHVIAMDHDGRSTRGRGRGRGGGRPRKSQLLDDRIAYQQQAAQMIYEDKNWTGSQYSPETVYQSIARPDSRRSSAGYPLGLSMSSQMQGSQAGSMLHDSYAHTKKTRTKPSRNADGILIRKDGRPDMRSQSSAANLRKVHARKEEERRESEYGESHSVSGHQGYSGLSTVESSAAQSVASDSPLSPGDEARPANRASEPPQHANVGQSTRSEVAQRPKTTEYIMKKMFPKGVDEERAKLATVGHYFGEPKSVEAREKAVGHELRDGIQALQADAVGSASSAERVSDSVTTKVVQLETKSRHGPVNLGDPTPQPTVTGSAPTQSVSHIIE